MMRKKLFGGHADAAAAVHQRQDASASSPALQEYATFASMAIPQAGPAATRYVSAPSSLSPVARAAAARITGNPIY